MKKIIKEAIILILLITTITCLISCTVQAAEETKTAKELINIMNENFTGDDRVVIFPIKQLQKEDNNNIYIMQDNVHLASIIGELQKNSQIDENYKYYKEIKSTLQNKLFAHIGLHIEKSAETEKIELIADDTYKTNLLDRTGFNFVEELEDGSYNITIEVTFKDLGSEVWYKGSGIDIFNKKLTLKGYANKEDTEPSYESEVILIPVDDIEEVPFKDVSETVWYYNSVKYCYDNGIIMGTTDTTFSPNNNLTRANLVTILWRMEGNQKVSGSLKFSDVKSQEYYYDAVNWAASKGIVNGYEDGKFRPNNNITREQLATILMNYARYKGKDTRERTDLNKFVDNKGISSYAKDSISWAVAKNVMSGKVNGTRIDPAGTASRAEAAAMIANYCNYIGR